MSETDLRTRLMNAIQQIEKRVQAAEARPTVEELEALKALREQDLKEIKKIREEIARLKEDM